MARRRGRTYRELVHPEPQQVTVSPQHVTPWDAFSNWSMKGAWRRLLFGSVVTIAILGMVGSAVPPIGDAARYAALKIRSPGAFERALPAELTSKSGVRVVERKTTLDLTGWRWTSSRDLQNGHKLSRGLSLSSFVLRKTEPGAKYFVHTVSSGSRTEPTIWCDSHPFRIVQTIRQPSSDIRQWNVLVDISHEPDDRPFTVNLVVTFWNGFQKKADWWSGFRVLHSTETAIYRVIFPAELPAADVKFRFKDVLANGMVDLDAAKLKVTPVPAGMPLDTLEWVVDNPVPDRSYQVTWVWPEGAAAADQPVFAAGT